MISREPPSLMSLFLKVLYTDLGKMHGHMVVNVPVFASFCLCILGRFSHFRHFVYAF